MVIFSLARVLDALKHKKVILLLQLSLAHLVHSPLPTRPNLQICNKKYSPFHLGPPCSNVSLSSAAISILITFTFSSFHQQCFRSTHIFANFPSCKVISYRKCRQSRQLLSSLLVWKCVWRSRRIVRFCCCDRRNGGSSAMVRVGLCCGAEHISIELAGLGDRLTVCLFLPPFLHSFSSPQDRGTFISETQHISCFSASQFTQIVILYRSSGGKKKKSTPSSSFGVHCLRQSKILSQVLLSRKEHKAHR